MLWGIQKSGGPVAEKIYVPLEVMREIPTLLRHSDWKVTGTIALVPGGYRLIDLQENDTSKRIYGAAVDLGSTTVVVYLWDLVNGRVVAVASNYNRQISCGEDILARVNFARKNGLIKTPGTRCREHQCSTDLCFRYCRYRPRGYLRSGGCR